MADEIECRDEYNIKEATMPILAFTFVMTLSDPIASFSSCEYI